MGAALAAALSALYVSTVLGWLPASILVAADLPGLMLTAMLGSLASWSWPAISWPATAPWSRPPA
jgi:hypothetical protein